MTTSLPILTFHDLSPGRGLLSLPPARFERILTTLVNAGWQCWPLLRLAQRLRDGLSLPSRTFCITFDDGYRSVHQVALPILRELNLTATVFALVGQRLADPDGVASYQGRSLLTWSELRELAEAGCSIGAHTITHRNLSRLSPSQALDEALQSRRVLSERLGLAEAEICAFAFPGGRASAAACAALEPFFACACTDELALVTAHSRPMALPRIDTYYLRHRRLAELLPGRWFEPYIRTISIPRRLRRSISDLVGDGVIRV